MRKDTRHTLHDLEGPWVDLYAILELSPDSDSATIRKRLSACYATASSNVQHRDISLRCYNQRLLEEILPQGLRILLNPPVREQYDALSLRHRSGDVEASDYASFVHHIYEIAQNAAQEEGQETSLAINAQPIAKQTRPSSSFRLPWEQDEEPAPAAAGKHPNEDESFFAAEPISATAQVAVVKTKPESEIEGPPHAPSNAPVASKPRPPIASESPAPVVSASAAALDIKATPAVAQPVTTVPLPVSTVIQDELATLHAGTPARHRYVERFVIEDPATIQPLLAVDPRCLSEMSRMLLAAMVGGALSFYIQLASVTNVSPEMPQSRAGHSHVMRSVEPHRSHAGSKSVA